MSVVPPPLKSASQLAITCPASIIRPELLSPALEILTKAGFQVTTDLSCHYASENYFAAPDQVRLQALQTLLDSPQVSAILMARGGYGISRIIQQIDWTQFQRQPKWLIGFSDITLLHLAAYKLSHSSSIHGGMVEYLQDKQSAESLFALLRGSSYDYAFPSHAANRVGYAEGILLGGNLSLLAHSAGSPYWPDLENALLFLEDVHESLHSMDRMLWQLAYSGVFAKIRGLVCGYFSNLRDNSPSFGQDIYAIVRAHCQDYDFPIAFDFPAGHETPNLALMLGAKHKLQVEHESCSLSLE